MQSLLNLRSSALAFVIDRALPCMMFGSTSLPFMKAMLKDQLRIPWNELKLDLQKFFMGTGQEAQLDAFFERKKHHSNRDLCKLLTFVTLPQHPYFDPRIIRGIHFDITCGYGDHQSAWSPMLHLELVPLAELYVKKLEEVQNAERLAIREYWTLRCVASLLFPLCPSCRALKVGSLLCATAGGQLLQRPGVPSITILQGLTLGGFITPSATTMWYRTLLFR